RADDLNLNAANALLKALEEPPTRTLFLLVATAEGRIPITIRSRSRALRVPALGAKDLENAVPAALARDDHEADAGGRAAALTVGQGCVRVARELAGGEGIVLSREIVVGCSRLPELDTEATHKLAERLRGGG